MGYKIIATILNVLDGPTEALDAAIALTARMGAHLDIYITTVSHTEGATYYMGASSVLVADQTREAIERREEIGEWVDKRMQGEVVPWAKHQATVQGGGLAGYLARRLRFADLVLLPRPDEYSDDAAQIIEACLFVAERPVLVIPKGCDAPKPDGRAVLGWNDSAEALAAARRALPLLQQAAQTDICIIDPPQHSADRSDPGQNMAQYLMRHGAKPEVAVLAKTEPNIGELLMRRAREADAQLIVTGAYGHSRLREAVFGGATRSLLEHADRPLFMSR